MKQSELTKFKKQLHKIEFNYLIDLILSEDREKLNAKSPNFRPHDLAFKVKNFKWKLSRRQKHALIDIYAKYIINS